jgi:hypothetical protein
VVYNVAASVLYDDDDEKLDQCTVLIQ